ncbi:hypothetical protein [Algivirga pacifica]|uniref:Resolvase HTH domain-containing protein n=1 Tax=Algivirga pacifica TaxID=1162670 RepID=A0ABP9D2I5_9BACT
MNTEVEERILSLRKSGESLRNIAKEVNKTRYFVVKTLQEVSSDSPGQLSDTVPDTPQPVVETVQTGFQPLSETLSEMVGQPDQTVENAITLSSEEYELFEKQIEEGLEYKDRYMLLKYDYEELQKTVQQLQSQQGLSSFIHEGHLRTERQLRKAKTTIDELQHSLVKLLWSNYRQHLGSIVTEDFLQKQMSLAEEVEQVLKQTTEVPYSNSSLLDFKAECKERLAEVEKETFGGMVLRGSRRVERWE